MIQPAQYVADFSFLGDAGRVIGGLVEKYPELKRIDQVAKDEANGKAETKEAVYAIHNYIMNDPEVLNGYAQDLGVDPNVAKERLQANMDNVIKKGTESAKSEDFMKYAYNNLEEIMSMSPALKKNGGLIAHNIANQIPAGRESWLKNVKGKEIANYMNTRFNSADEKKQYIYDNQLSEDKDIMADYEGSVEAEGEAAKKAYSIEQQKTFAQNLDNAKGVDFGNDYNSFVKALTQNINMNDEPTADMVNKALEYQWRLHEVKGKRAQEKYDTDVNAGVAREKAKSDILAALTVQLKEANDKAVALKRAIDSGDTSQATAQAYSDAMSEASYYNGEIDYYRTGKRKQTTPSPTYTPVPEDKPKGFVEGAKAWGKGVKDFWIGEPGSTPEDQIETLNPGSKFINGTLYDANSRVVGSMQKGVFTPAPGAKVNTASTPKDDPWGTGKY